MPIDADFLISHRPTQIYPVEGAESHLTGQAQTISPARTRRRCRYGPAGSRRGNTVIPLRGIKLTKLDTNELTYQINGAIFEVNKVLGAGFLEKIYPIK